MEFDIKIDDIIKNLENSKCKLLFTTWQNKNYFQDKLEKEEVIRVNNWKDIEKILLD